MKDTIRDRCGLFIENRDIIKAASGWESAYLYPISAGIFTSKGVRAEASRIHKCRDLLIEKTGIFSNFRGATKLATIAMIACADDAEEQLTRMLAVYDSLKGLFWSSPHLTITAGAIAQIAEPDRYDEIARRTREVYNLMKSAHPFLTSSEDSVFAALLSLSDKSEAKIAEETAICYDILKQKFLLGNAVQSLSHVLALGDLDAQDKCNKIIDLYDTLKSRGYKYGTGYELATLGAFALTDADISALADDIIAADTCLKGYKGFGAFGIGSKQRLMHAGIIAMYEYIPDNSAMQLAAQSGVISLIIAQQAAVCASVAAASAASASASS